MAVAPLVMEWKWHLGSARRSLWFASEGNLGMSEAITRATTRITDAEAPKEKTMGNFAVKTKARVIADPRIAKYKFADGNTHASIPK